MSRLNMSSLQVNDLIANPPDPSAGDGGGHMHGLPQALLGELKNKMGLDIYVVVHQYCW